MSLGLAFAQGPPPQIADELLVGLRASAQRSRAQAAYRAAGATLIKEIPQLRIHRLRVDAANIEAVEAALKRRGEFVFVERNRAFPPLSYPTTRSISFNGICR